MENLQNTNQELYLYMNQLYKRAQLHLRPLNSFCDVFTFQTPSTPSSPFKHHDAAKAGLYHSRVTNGPICPGEQVILNLKM
jgi:hypothetical protein